MRALIISTFLLFSGWLSHSVYAIPVAWDNDKDGPWLTQESEHFVITYPEKNATLASKSLNIAERVHQELLPFFGSAPKAKTQMVLVDDFDVSNGWATFFPFAQIRLYSSPPDTVAGLEESDDWLHTLIRHEYVHILHMEMADSTPENLRDVFGRLLILFPHAITPSFMLEGLATYLETNHDLQYGRLQSAYYAMQMRMEVASEKLKSLSDVSAPLREWPLGMQYLYGSYFYQFLASEYGEDKIQQYLKLYSRELIPAFFQNKSAKRAFGKDFPDLWLEYEAWLVAKFSPSIEKIQREGGAAADLSAGVRTQFQSQTDGLFQDSSASAEGSFYYIDNNGEDRLTLMKTDFSSPFLTESEYVADTKGIVTLDVNEQHDIAATRLITWADGRAWADVYVLNDGSWQALTHKQRLRNVRWLNSDWLIASRKEYGISQLILLNKQGEQTLLWQGDDAGDVLGDYAIASGGDYLIAAMKRNNQGWNLERLNLTLSNNTVAAAPTWTRVTQTKAIENSPQILADGRILYSANYNDVYNLYILEPNNNQVTQLTHMLGGAFAPKFITDSEFKNGRVIFQAYTENGFEFRQLPLRDDESTASLASNHRFDLKKVQGQLNYPDPFSTEVETQGPHSYSPWQTLNPTWWLPFFSLSSDGAMVGALTSGTDALGRHAYSVQASVDSQYSLANLNTSYVYDNRYQFIFDRRHEYNEIKNVGDFVVEQDRWTFARLNMANALEDQLSLNSALVIEREGTITRDNLLSLRCRDGNSNFHKTCEKSLLGLGLRFDNREAYLNSPGFSSGRYLDLVVETNEAIASDYSGEVYQGQWLELFDLPGRRSLSLQTLWGKVDKRGEDFSIGGDNRASESVLFGRGDFALRGYESSVMSGQYFNINRISYTQWLARIEKGFYNWPIAIGDISAKVFGDYGSAWNDSNDAEYLTGVGLEMNVEVMLFYNMLLPVSVSYAHGTDSELGDDRFALGISVPY